MPGQAGRVPARDPARSVLDHMVGCCGGRSEAVEGRDGGEKARGLEEQADVRSRVWQCGGLQSRYPSEGLERWVCCWCGPSPRVRQ